MPPQYHPNTRLPLFLGDLPESGRLLMMMPRSRLKIEFYGDRGTSEQILMIPFRDGEDVKYFMVGA
jgi:hypothetical protein